MAERTIILPLSLSAGLLLCALTGCGIEILHDLDEAQANEVLAALQREGIIGDKQRTTQGSKASYAVAIPRSAAPRAWGILRQQNLPRQRHKGLGDVFGESALVPTPIQERARMHQAIAGELARTLESLEGVRRARVHVVLPAKRILGADGPPPPPRAAVMLQLVGSSKPVISAEEVRRIVSGSVEQLEPKAVEVVIVRGGGKRDATAAAATVSVGPFQVAAGSRGALLATLVIAVVLIGGLALTVLFLARLRKRPMVAEPGRAASSATNLSALMTGGPDYLTRGTRSVAPDGAGDDSRGLRA